MTTNDNRRRQKPVSQVRILPGHSLLSQFRGYFRNQTARLRDRRLILLATFCIAQWRSAHVRLLRWYASSIPSARP
jgi:hypothetical protein